MLAHRLVPRNDVETPIIARPNFNGVGQRIPIIIVIFVDRVFAFFVCLPSNGGFLFYLGQIIGRPFLLSSIKGSHFHLSETPSEEASAAQADLTC